MDNKSRSKYKIPGPNIIIIPVLLVISVTRAAQGTQEPRQCLFPGPGHRQMVSRVSGLGLIFTRGGGGDTLRVTLLPLVALVLPPLS